MYEGSHWGPLFREAAVWPSDVPASSGPPAYMFSLSEDSKLLEHALANPNMLRASNTKLLAALLLALFLCSGKGFYCLGWGPTH